MKGLLIKEWFVLWKQGKLMIFLALIYSIYAAFGNGYFFAGFSVVFLSMLPITIMGLDERSKWDHYAVTMPYSRKDIVLSKYIVTLSGVTLAALLFVLSTALKWIIEKNPADFAGLMKEAMMLLALGLFYSTLNLPIAFKFGVDKGRMWFILITVIIIAGLGVAFKLMETDATQIEIFFQNLPAIAPSLASLGLLLLSASISIRIYENKEL
jgi:ABC-2 type transport system permease protein